MPDHGAAPTLLARVAGHFHFAMKSSTSKAVWYTTLAAGAATAPAVDGAIRFTDVNPDLTASTVTWDLDNGGVEDFRLEVGVNGANEKSNLVPIVGGNASGIALSPNNNADRMAAGEIIGGATPFSNATDTKTLFDEGAPANYDWSVGSRGFLGLQINLLGNTHYGWADVSINPAGVNSFNHTLYGYAFEDVASTAILAGAVPEPSMATLLVAGAAGVASMRRRRR